MQREIPDIVPLESTTDQVALWRSQMLDRILLSTFVVGLIVVIVASAVLLRDQPLRAQRVIPGFMIIMTILGVMTFVRRLPYLVRAGTPVAIFYTLAVISIAQMGLGGEGRIFLLTAAALSSLLFGRTVGIIATVLSGLTVAAIGFVLVSGMVTPIAPTALNPGPWITASFVQMLNTLLIVLSAGYLVNQLIGTWKVADEQTHVLEVSQQLATQQANDLAAQTERLTKTEQMLRDLVATLETPIIRLSGMALLAPLVGVIDAQRTETITKRLLAAAANARSQLIIIDISGVSAVDATTINGLLATTQALRLIGCRVTLTGIAPEVALLLSQSGVDLRVVHTARSPEQALEQELASRSHGRGTPANLAGVDANSLG